MFLATLGFVSVPFAPWWVPFGIAIILCIRFRAWEVAGMGLFMDLLWLPQVVTGESLPYATLGALLLLLVFEPLRRRLFL